VADMKKAKVRKDIPIKNTTITIDGGMYLIPIMWVIGDYEYYKKVLKRKCHIEYDEQKFFGGETSLVTDEENGEAVVVIWIPEISFTVNNYDSIVHELSHAVWNILSCTGVKIGPENNEPFAYLLAYVFSKSLLKFKKLYEKLNS
jgi:hypothetical protein